ncbi:MAG: hypothetical protein MZV70_40840 [Desulfobacterales bacterium]|nr:hypothetical protein [Desulfobacterales bacterium]
MILHVDMDAFYASVEQLDHPAAEGPAASSSAAPAGAGWSRRRATRPADSGSVRPCRSSRPGSSARRGCSSTRAWTATGRFPPRSCAVLQEFSPLVEPVSIDEAFMDLAGTERLHGPPADLAPHPQETDPRNAVHLTCSVGVAPNRFLAKIASDFKKPDGLTVIRPGTGARLHRPASDRQGAGDGSQNPAEGRGARHPLPGRHRADSPGARRSRRSSGPTAGGCSSSPAASTRPPSRPTPPAKSVSSECTLEEDTRETSRADPLPARTGRGGRRGPAPVKG